MSFQSKYSVKSHKRNAHNNKALKKIYLEKGITRCELRFDCCADGEMLSFAHRHKRRWYLGREYLLRSFHHTILACIPCHQEIEKDKELTERQFLRLRGKENSHCKENESMI
jgi:hypothetical protein